MIFLKELNQLAFFVEQSKPIIIDLPQKFRNRRLYPTVEVWDNDEVEIAGSALKEAYQCLTN